MKLKLIGIDEPATVTPAGHGLYIEKVGSSLWLVHTERGYRIGSDYIRSREAALLLASVLGPLGAKHGFDWRTLEKPVQEDDPHWAGLAAEVKRIADGFIPLIEEHNTIVNLKLTPAMVRYLLLADNDGWLPGLGEKGRDMRTQNALLRRDLVHDDRLSAWLSMKLNERGLQVRDILRAGAAVRS